MRSRDAIYSIRTIYKTFLSVSRQTNTRFKASKISLHDAGGWWKTYKNIRAGNDRIILMFNFSKNND